MINCINVDIEPPVFDEPSQYSTGQLFGGTSCARPLLLNNEDAKRLNEGDLSSLVTENRGRFYWERLVGVRWRALPTVMRECNGDFNLI